MLVLMQNASHARVSRANSLKRAIRVVAYACVTQGNTCENALYTIKLNYTLNTYIAYWGRTYSKPDINAYASINNT